MKYLLPLFLGLLLFSSCAKRRAEQAEKDKQIILQYIEDHNLDATASGTGLYYVIDTLGTGVHPHSSSTVTVAYTGYLSDGTVFDESDASGATFSLLNVIEGWAQGIPYFKEGGSGMLLIPSELGYGRSSRPGIPENSVLIFEVRLIDVL